MAFTSIDQLISSLSSLGKTSRIPFSKVIQTGATSVAGRFHEVFSGAGTGGAGILTGTAGLGTALGNSTQGSIPLNPSTVTPDTKHLLGLLAGTNSTTVVPGMAMLVDLLYIYPSCVVTGTPTTFNNTAPRPTRLNNGQGVQCGAIVVGALGAAQPVLTVNYTDQDNNTQNGTLSASANSLPVGSMLAGSPTAGILGSPAMALATGDSGVRQLNSYTIASGTTGTVTFVLYRPLAMIPLVGANIWGERDFLNQMPSLPTIPDDACLSFFVNIGGAMTTNQTIYGEMVTAWG